MGPVHNDRIGMLFCMDGTAIYDGLSVTPAEYQVLSLHPSLRVKPEWMFLSLLMPTKLKAASQKKYFDFLVAAELNPLAAVGVRHPGGTTKVIVFGTSFDLPQKDKFFGLRGLCSVTTPVCYRYLHVVNLCGHPHSLGFQSVHGCPDCLQENPSYCGRMMYLGSRRHLSPDSPLRERRCGVYQFVDSERRAPPARRTTRSMKVCLQIVKDNDFLHVCGFACVPMMEARLGFDWTLDCLAEWMHALARVFLCFANILFGGRGDSSRAQTFRSKDTDRKQRLECEELNIFPSVWINRQSKLTDRKRDALLAPTDEDITDATRPFLERWLHTVGVNTRDMLRPALVQKVTEIRQQLRQPGDFFFVPRKLAPLPWRLNREAFNDVDRRVLNMILPHNTESICRDGRSFLNFSKASNKTSKKLLILLVILPTVLRGYVQPLRRGMRLIILGLRMIDGQVHSYNASVRLGVVPGSRTFDPSLVPKIRELLVTGIAMVTGSVPPSSLVACIHLLCHYADHAELFGILRWYWMFVFERYNRFVKKMCNNTNYPLASIANTYLKRAAHHYHLIANGMYQSPSCSCFLMGKNGTWHDVPNAVVTSLFG